jgi:hypothetical protein
MDLIAFSKTGRVSKKRLRHIRGVFVAALVALAAGIFHGHAGALPSLIGQDFCKYQTVTCSKSLPAITKDKIDLFLLIGSSNMAGRAMPLKADSIPDPQVINCMIGWGGWMNTIEPSRLPTERVYGDLVKGGQSCGFAFGKKYVELHPDRYVGLLCCGQIGFMLGAFTGKKFGLTSAWGPIFGLNENGQKTGIDLIDFATSQGYHKWGGIVVVNNPRGLDPSQYASGLKKMIDSARVWLKEPTIPVVVAEPAPFEMKGEPTQFSIGAVNGKKWYDAVHDLPNQVPNTAFIKTDDCKSLIESGEQPIDIYVDSVTHFDHTSNIKMGQRFAEAFLLLDKSNSSVKFSAGSISKGRVDNHRGLSICFGTPRMLKQNSASALYDMRGKVVQQRSSLRGIWIVTRR